MLPSPPLTVESCGSPHPSLKRSFSDAHSDDADVFTPLSPAPPKRQRCSPSPPISLAHWHCLDGVPTDFDPARLVSPPEYAHVPYDPDFGAKVCEQYKLSLTARRACNAVVSTARQHKYGTEDALAFSPGSTPDHIRQRYEDKQQQLDEVAADIIANSDSEADVECGDGESGESGTQIYTALKAAAPDESYQRKLDAGCQGLSRPSSAYQDISISHQRTKLVGDAVSSVRLVLRKGDLAARMDQRRRLRVFGSVSCDSFTTSSHPRRSKLVRLATPQGGRHCRPRAKSNISITGLCRGESFRKRKEFGGVIL